MNLIRLKDYEDKVVKYALTNEDESIRATLIYSQRFKDEMEIRIVLNNERLPVLRGHKSIMDNYSFEDFENKVFHMLRTHNELNQQVLSR